MTAQSAKSVLDIQEHTPGKHPKIILLGTGWRRARGFYGAQVIQVAVLPNVTFTIEGFLGVMAARTEEGPGCKVD